MTLIDLMLSAVEVTCTCRSPFGTSSQHVTATKLLDSSMLLQAIHSICQCQHSGHKKSSKAESHKVSSISGPFSTHHNVTSLALGKGITTAFDTSFSFIRGPLQQHDCHLFIQHITLNRSGILIHLQTLETLEAVKDKPYLYIFCMLELFTLIRHLIHISLFNCQ